MGIKFRCNSCQKKLHVKAFLAGKRGVCPHCGGKVRIPLESQDTSQPATAAIQAQQSSAGRATSKKRTAAKSRVPEPAERSTNGSRSEAPAQADPLAESPQAVWYVRPPTGGQYGPADNEIMRRWLDEGRIGPDSLVWREGWSDWKTAAPLFPSLARATDDAPSTTALADVPEQAIGEFSFANEQPVAERMKGRPRRKSQQRNIAILVVLSLMVVALLVALIVVLQQQS